jgi:hypothetical protein
LEKVPWGESLNSVQSSSKKWKQLGVRINQWYFPLTIVVFNLKLEIFVLWSIIMSISFNVKA